MIITIDGPAGSGKSSTAKALARRLGFRYLDTGAMYRAVALAVLQRGLDWDQADDIARLARRLDIRLVGEQVFLDGEDVTEAIRSSEVTAVTRYVADNPQVREHLVQQQRELAGKDDIVTEGRDQGTVAFPEAECKFFLTAGAEERARRRFRDLQAQGEPVSLEQVLTAQQRRDEEDAARPVGALRPAPDAIEVSTDSLTLEEVVERLMAIVNQKRTAQLK